MMKIAFLFLVRNGFNHSVVWDKFFENVPKSKYSIVIHCKDAIFKQEQYQKFVLPYKIPTQWEFTAKAEAAMMNEAYKDEQNKKFIFLSESCLPIRSFNEIYDDLLKSENKSFLYFHWQKMSHASRCPHTAKLRAEYFNSERMIKNSQWRIIDRKHVSGMLEDTILFNKIANFSFADNETYSGMFFYTKGILENEDEVICRQTHYVQWGHQSRRLGSGGGHPMDFWKNDDLEKSLFQEAIDKNCFFIRKVSKQFPINQWPFQIKYQSTDKISESINLFS